MHSSQTGLKPIMAAMFILEANHLEKTYGGRTVVKGVSLNVGDGEIVGLLGRNGAGKTTTFRMVMGMITPDKGDVQFSGVDVTKLPMYKRARRGLGYLAQNASVFQRLSVQDNLLAVLETCALTRAQRKARAAELLDQFNLTKTARQQAHTLSGGERRKLEIARALVTQPSLILLDEPFSAIDPVAVEELQQEILRLRDEQHIAMLITDHNVQRTLEIVDRAYVMLDGQVFADGTPKEIVANEQVRKAYLGTTFRGDEFE